MKTLPLKHMPGIDVLGLTHMPGLIHSEFINVYDIHDRSRCEVSQESTGADKHGSLPHSHMDPCIYDRCEGSVRIWPLIISRVGGAITADDGR